MQSFSLLGKSKRKSHSYTQSFLSLYMNFLPKLSPPMWVVSTSLFSAIIASNARLDPAVSIVLNPNPPLLLHFQSSAHMDAQPPDMPVRVVNHQDVNRRILAALIVASSLLATILFFLICFWIYRHKKSKNSDKKSIANSDVGGGLQLGPAISKLNYAAASARKGSVTVFEYRLLESATNNFHESNLLGKGDCGHVYKARFDEKFLAVVKRLDESDEDAERQFEIEVNWLSKIHHQNIISLLGYCVNGAARFLVYETMQNGSLESQLHGPLRGSALPWQLRMKIAVDVARGLEFLHERCNPPVVHRNLKSSHILLDSNFNAKLSDFGLAITLGAQNKNSLKPSGTLSCLAPEYFLDGKLTDKSDVYAFGVILLELLIGKNPAEKISTGQTQSSLVKWAMPQLTDRSKLPDLVDPVVKDTMDLKHLYQVAAVAVLCIQPEPSYRPLITDVLHSLIPLLPLELGGSLRMSEPANLGLP